ncbi:MAG TPA: cytidylate kinase-like family protein [Terriglobales bacterium]
MIRVVTVSREYGSGGGQIAARLAGKLGWDLLDKKLIADVADRFRMRDSAARRLQEHGSWWLERIARAIWLETGGSTVQVVDAEAVHQFTTEAILQAHERGTCVIVGRGAQCVLRNLPDVLHIFVFAPLEHRIARLTGKYPNSEELLAAIARVDEERAAYIREFHDVDWKDPSLYHLWINGKRGVDPAVNIILNAVRSAED